MTTTRTARTVIHTAGAGLASVDDLNGRWLGDVQRDSVAEEIRPGVVRERYGWAAIPRHMVAVADPVRQAGASVFPARREAADWLAGA